MRDGDLGAGGDLTRRLVVPALYNLMTKRLLPDEFALIGVDIAALSTEQWRQRLTEMMQTLPLCHYPAGPSGQASPGDPGSSGACVAGGFSWPVQ